MHFQNLEDLTLQDTKQYTTQPFSEFPRYYIQSKLHCWILSYTLWWSLFFFASLVPAPILPWLIVWLVEICYAYVGKKGMSMILCDYNLLCCKICSSASSVKFCSGKFWSFTCCAKCHMILCPLQFWEYFWIGLIRWVVSTGPMHLCKNSLFLNSTK